MRLFRPAAILVCTGLIVLLTACEDPSNVGLGVGGELAGGEPVTVRLAPSTFATETFDDLSGNVDRILIGRTNDPVIGQMTARGYLDVASPAVPPDDLPAGPIEYAELRLFPEYRYGDTLATGRFALNDMPSEWDGAGLPTDTTLTGGAFIRDFSLTPTDSVVNVPLPEAWIAANSEVLRDTSDAFNDRFNGFQVVPASGNAITGINANDSQLRLVVGGDTTAFSITQTFTGLQREPGSLALPPGRRLVQDGFGAGIAIDFTLPDSLRDRPISRAELVLPTDTLTLQGAPAGNANFVRTATRDFRLIPVLPSGDLATSVSLDFAPDEAAIVFRQGAREIFEAELLGRPQVDRFRLLLSPGALTVNPALLFGPDAPAESRPYLILTVTASDA